MIFGTKKGDKLLDLLRRKRIAKWRHLPLAIENAVRNSFVGPMFLFADFSKNRAFFRAFKVGAMTPCTVVAEKDRTTFSLIRLRYLGGSKGGKRN